MFISVVMMVVTVLFAGACPFVFRDLTGAAKTRLTSALLHTVIFEIVSVAVFEICRAFYLANPYVSNSANPDMFRYIHSIICSVLAVCAVVFVVMRLRSGMLGRVITAGSAALGSIALALGGHFALRAIEASAEREVGTDDGGLPIVIGDGLTNEYTVVALPVLLVASLCVIFAAANILLDTDKKWARGVMTAVNIITVAVYAVIFYMLLNIGSELSEGSGEAVYAMAFIGIIVALPPIICMCSVFSDKIETASKSAKSKAKK